MILMLTAGVLLVACTDASANPNIVIEKSTDPIFQGTDAAEEETVIEAETAHVPESAAPAVDEVRDYVLNTNTMRFHYPDCKSAAKIKPENREDVQDTREALLNLGYKSCGNCHP